MVLFYRVNVSIRRVPIVSRNKFNDQTATTQVDLTIRIVKFTKSHYDNNHFFLSGVKYGGTTLKESLRTLQIGSNKSLLERTACELLVSCLWTALEAFESVKCFWRSLSKFDQRALNNENLQIIFRWIMAAKSFIETSLLEECFYITYVYIHLHLLHTT